MRVNMRSAGRVWGAAIIVTLGIGVGLSAQTAEWTEARAGYGFRISPQTFATEAVFHVALRYERPVVCPDIEVSWLIVDVTGGGETIIDDLYSHYPNKYCRAPSIASFEVLSPFFAPEPRRTYEAWISINDLKHGLSYEAVLAYAAPASLPSALPLNVAAENGGSSYRFDRWTDEQLEELLLWSNHLEATTVQTASDVALADFFDEWVRPESVYPAEVWTVVKVADEVDFADQLSGVTFSPSYTRILFSFFVPDSRSISSVLDELRAFSPNLEFIGEVRTLSDSSELEEDAPRIFFVDTDVPQVVHDAQEVFNTRESD
ncbi:hypothetical protein JW848_01395 [Candidatus Bipolaricaulota bacterium]|nr:hypothetical protein [Candidatus Bipolaricaulota bacterium]